MPPLPLDSRPVADFNDPRRDIPGYAVRADGLVLYYSTHQRKWIPLKRKMGPGGFVKVRIRTDGKEREIGVALLVLRAWVGPRPTHHEPLHFPDPDPANNRLDNLRWAPVGTSKAGRLLGPTPPPVRRGSERPNALLTEADIPAIRDLYRAGVGYQEIAEQFEVAEETIRLVLVGKAWSHVPDPLGPIVMRRHGPPSDECARSKLDSEQAREIRARSQAGENIHVLASEYAVSACAVRDVLKGRTWKGVI